MTGVMEAALAILLAAATIDVPAGSDLAAALARARPGDRVRLAAGEHRGALGRLAGLSVEGAGAESTTVVAPEGEAVALVASGEARLAGLALRAGREACALKVTGGAVRLDDVALLGGACGAFVEGGRVEGRRVDLAGRVGLLLDRHGDVALDEGSARGRLAGVSVVGGAVRLRRFAIVGPSLEGALAVAAGKASLEAVVIRAPGPSGIAVSAGGSVDGVEVTVAGAVESGGALGDCVQAISGSVRLVGATLLGCAGAAVEVSGGDLSLAGVDASGGSAGCLVLVNGASADLSGNLCAGNGPGLVLAGGAKAAARVSRWWTDPALWVDCGSGSRVTLGRGETVAAPCAAAR